MRSENAQSGASERIRRLPNSITVVQTQAGDVLVNCPPETLKYLLASNIVPPATILLPPDVPSGSELGSGGFVRRGINYASVEFLIYSNFFVNKRKVRLITVTDDQARRLRIMLEEPINGPSDLAMDSRLAWLRAECAAVAYYPPLGRAPTLDDMAEIASLESGGGRLGPVTIDLEGEDFVFREEGSVVARVSTRISGVAMPLTLAPPRPLQRHEVTLQFIGGSDGFDPDGITTCFLAYIGNSVETQATLFDAAAYVYVRLSHLGLSTSHIAEVVLSHLHEDHLAGLPELILMGSHRVRLVTSDLIYRGLLRMLSAMLALPIPDVAALFDYVPLNPGTLLELDGRNFEAIYAVHSVPTLAVRVNGVCYSGDMRYDEEWFDELVAQGILSPARRQELVRFAEGASILVQDVGGGTIHSTISSRLLQALTAKSQRLVLAHTRRHDLPETSSEVAARVEFAASGSVVGVGAPLPDDARTELVETIAACPLFARLSTQERLAMAEQVEVVPVPDQTVIFREGEPQDGTAYIVHSGVVAINIGGTEVRVLGRGSSIGERGVLLGHARSSTTIARGPVTLLRLRPEVFGPAAERLGLRAACARAEWLAQAPVLRELPWASLLDLALDLQPRHLAAGERLFARGELAYEGYLLVNGVVRFIGANGSVVEELREAGSLFGCRAALYGTPHDLTAQVVTPTEVWALAAPALERLNLIYPHVLMHVRALEANLGSRLNQEAHERNA